MYLNDLLRPETARGRLLAIFLNAPQEEFETEELMRLSRCGRGTVRAAVNEFARDQLIDVWRPVPEGLVLQPRAGPTPYKHSLSHSPLAQALLFLANTGEVEPIKPFPAQYSQGVFACRGCGVGIRFMKESNKLCGRCEKDYEYLKECDGRETRETDRPVLAREVHTNSH